MRNTLWIPPGHRLRLITDLDPYFLMTFSLTDSNTGLSTTIGWGVH